MPHQPDARPDFAHVIARARATGLRSTGDRRWVAALPELFPNPTDCAAFVRWASEHPTWRHNVADVADRVCAKPTEAAVVILADIVDELMEDEDEPTPG